MKLTMILLTVAFLNVSANGVSQAVSFNGKNAPLKEVFSAIEKQTGFRVAYNKILLDKASAVTLNVTNISLEDFLRQVFHNQPLNYSIKNKTIFISSKTNQVLSVDLELTDSALMPPGIVQGRVMNENAEPLAGANVMVKGTSQGATTDNNGYYKMENIATGTYTLEISYVGYATKTTIIKVLENGTATFDFKLSPSLVNLDQLTVTSTLSARAIRSVPTTMAVLTQADLKNRNLNNIANVLEAIPGIIIQPGSESDNSGNTRQPKGLLIRGTAGYGVAGIKYLVDGVEIVSDVSGRSILQTMDPNDIQKIEILKGPMASTLYGSGAGGGIISITTKKGKQGKTKVNFKTMFTQYANDYADYSGYSQNYSANVSGGGDQFNFFMGAAYNLYPTTKLTDINNGIDDKTWSYNARIGGKVNSIAADVSFQYGNEKNGSGSTAISYNKYLASLGIPPFPISPLQDSRTYQRSFLTSLHLTHTLANNWYHDLTIGYNIMNNTINYYTPNAFSGAYLNYEYLYSKINARYFMFYDHSWSTNLKSSVTAGFEYNSYETHNMLLNSTTPLTNFLATSTPATEGSASFNKSPSLSTGYFAEAVTSFNKNLFLTTGIRFDFNNAYGDNVGGYAQPRVGLSYVIESGAFNIKPRVVWGVSSTPPDPSYKTAHTDVSPYYTAIFTGSPDLKPQRSEGYELGADVFYGSNYSLNLTYYDQKIKDMIQQSYIIDYTTNPTTFTYHFYNIANAINRGLEVSAKAVFDPFTIDLSYTHTTSKWGNEVGEPSAIIYPGAPNQGIPKKSIFARVTYKIPSLLPWTAKGGGISLDWRYNGSAYFLDDITLTNAFDAWIKSGYTLPYPDQNDYYIWQKGYSNFNLRADYSLTNYATIYVDVQNLLDKQGSLTGRTLFQFPGRRINFGFNINF